MAVKLEFVINSTCVAHYSKIEENLCKIGIPKSSIQTLHNVSSIIIKTTLPSTYVLNTIESTGVKAVLKGYGSTTNANMDVAVAMLGGTTGYSDSNIKGIVRFIQINENQCIVDGTIDGLTPGKHGIHIYECGDVSNGCESIGNHLNLLQTKHGSQIDDKSHRHTGDLGNIEVDAQGRTTFYLYDHLLNVSDLIGRSIAVTENEDDCGKTNINSSEVDGNCGKNR
ncbi:copper chaperone for superoxide dismutase isoform X2 [Daktulosphaira vitifoliae]|uniref:copper chaperone for superoxide dismutase isoform X2 n=1 Tax=Daktulosphaira vitifoliae TaxID=58002 RepID=UPI0021A9BD7F|nr:copper chaperone for superoxide dismutase isoform X2 [Daktulosphaira vitifoliae]